MNVQLRPPFMIDFGIARHICNNHFAQKHLSGRLDVHAEYGHCSTPQLSTSIALLRFLHQFLSGSPLPSSLSFRLCNRFVKSYELDALNQCKYKSTRTALAIENHGSLPPASVLPSPVSGSRHYLECLFHISQLQAPIAW